MPDLPEEWLAVIGRALSFLCLHVADLRDKELSVQATILEGLGMSRREAAKMLGTSEDSLRVLIARKGKGGHRGRKKKSS